MYDCSTGPNDPPRRCHNTHRCTGCTSPNAKQKLARNSIRSMQLVLRPLICCLFLVCKFAILQACAGAASVGPLVHTIDAFISICRFSSCRLNGRASQLAEYVLRHVLGPSFIEVPSSRQAVYQIHPAAPLWRCIGCTSFSSQCWECGEQELHSESVGCDASSPLD